MGFKENTKQDLDVFFNTNEFAGTASFGEIETEIIYKVKDEAVINETLHFNIPTAIIKKEFLAKNLVKSGDSFLFKGVNYYIMHIEDKDTTLATLYLSKDNRNTF